MIAGLPGVGLGGLFYVCLALLMPLRFLFGDKRARQPRQKRIMMSVLPLTLAILAVLALEGWGLHALAGLIEPTTGVAADLGGLRGSAPRLALLPFVLLAVLVGVTHLVRLILQTGRAKRQVEPHLLDQAPLGTDTVQVADQEHAQHELRIDRRPSVARVVGL